MSFKVVTPSIASIAQWYKTMTGENVKENLKSIIAASGNYFILDTGNLSTITQYDKFHIYLGLDAGGALKLYAVPGANDKAENINIYTLNLIPISVSFTKGKIEDTFANHQDLIKNANNWLNEDELDKWIDNVYSQENGNLIPLAFRIDASDFKAGDVHACYFALKFDDELGFRNMDLVIANTGPDQIPMLLLDGTPYDKSSVFEDMARPVPPYDNDVEFGIFDQLNISY
ncbi:hypothetical protein [Kordia sp.]|uniref:hypothetical protein n=1 Tax=Kordia sp. TaxID=1965332 RepID=UPI003B5BEABD